MEKTDITLSAALTHFGLAFAVSFGLSVFFWLAFDVFILVPFLVVSSACALLAAILGTFLLRRYWVTVVLSALLRCAVFLIAIGPG